MFVVAEDFDRIPFNLVIPQAQIDSGTFDDFVSYHEEENLRKLLGNLFYLAFVDGIAAMPDGVGTNPLDLFYPKVANAIGDNVVYVVEDVADIYECIQATDGTQLPTNAAYFTKQALNRWVRLKWGDSYLYYGRPQKWYGFNRLVVALIYYLWTKYTYDSQTGSGIVVTANENSTTVSPAARLSRAWNAYARLCAGDFPNVVDPNFLVWPELENSLFGYLYLNSATFDDLVVNVPGFNTFKAYLAYSFTFPGKTNVFGI